MSVELRFENGRLAHGNDISMVMEFARRFDSIGTVPYQGPTPPWLCVDGGYGEEERTVANNVVCTRGGVGAHGADALSVLSAVAYENRMSPFRFKDQSGLDRLRGFVRQGVQSIIHNRGAFHFHTSHMAETHRRETDCGAWHLQIVEPELYGLNPGQALTALQTVRSMSSSNPNIYESMLKRDTHNEDVVTVNDDRITTWLHWLRPDEQQRVVTSFSELPNVREQGVMAFVFDRVRVFEGLRQTWGWMGYKTRAIGDSTDRMPEKQTLFAHMHRQIDATNGQLAAGLPVINRQGPGQISFLGWMQSDGSIK